MIPGPVEVEDSVLQEMGGQVRPHYGAEWIAVHNETVSLLKQVFQTEGDVYILVGSGTSGLDAGIGSLTSSGDKIVIGNNGFFGDRLRLIAQSYGLNIISVEAKLGERLDPSEFERVLDQHPDAALTAVVHLETSTTVMNPVEEIAGRSRERGVPVLVDAVSSLGGAPLKVDSWGIDICVGATQKCLSTPPGLSPLSISPRAWQIMSEKPERGHGWYLNLETWKQYAEEWADWHPFPISMATNNVLALRAGVKSLLSDGLDNRIQHYSQLAQRLRDGARKLGLQPLTPDEEMSPVVTAIFSPEGVPSGDIVRYLNNEHQIKIAGGLGAGLKDRVFRVGHMGAMINVEDIDAVLNALAEFIKNS